MASYVASETKGVFQGNLEGGGFLFSPMGITGHFSGRKTPDIAKTYDILFLRKTDGSDTCRVVIPDVESVVADSIAKVGSFMMGYCPKKKSLETYCGIRFLLEGESHIKKMIENEISDAIRSGRGVQGSQAIDTIRYAVESSEKPMLEVRFLGKQSGEVSVAEHMTVGEKRYVFVPKVFLSQLERVLSELYPLKP